MAGVVTTATVEGVTDEVTVEGCTIEDMEGAVITDMEEGGDIPLITAEDSAVEATVAVVVTTAAAEEDTTMALLCREEPTTFLLVRKPQFPPVLSLAEEEKARRNNNKPTVTTTTKTSLTSTRNTPTIRERPTWQRRNRPTSKRVWSLEKRTTAKNNIMPAAWISKRLFHQPTTRSSIRLSAWRASSRWRPRNLSLSWTDPTLLMRTPMPWRDWRNPATANANPTTAGFWLPPTISSRWESES